MHQGRHEAVLNGRPVLSEGRTNWTAAALLGLTSSTFSTLVSQLAAARVGRDAAVDWMTVAAIPARDQILTDVPSWPAIVTGIAFHQWADFSWAIVFFGLLGRWTSHLSAPAIAAVALPWALFTSALEWSVLVPVFPFAQPIFTLQQPYWIGFLVHLSSASVYPLFPWFRALLTQTRTKENVRFLTFWSGGLLGGLAICAALASLAASGHELRWMGHDREPDQQFIRHMVTHHQQGIELAALAAARAQDPHLRALARLMVASQAGENEILQAWWKSWFDIPMTICSAAERAVMPGLLSAEQIEQLRRVPDSTFDTQFVQAMTYHHAGAVRMADDELHGSGDLRLKLFAHAIRHGQQGEIALMNGASGWPAVSLAIANSMADNVNRKSESDR